MMQRDTESERSGSIALAILQGTCREQQEQKRLFFLVVMWVSSKWLVIDSDVDSGSGGPRCVASTQCKTIFASSATDSRLTTELSGDGAADKGTCTSVKVGGWQISDTVISLSHHHVPSKTL
jgi:hypothetical protein